MPAGELFGLACLIIAVCKYAPGSITHVVCFTDATPARSAINSGGSGAAQLETIIEWLHSHIGHTQLLSVHQPGKRNRAADTISRGAGLQIKNEAKKAGFKIVSLPLPLGAFDLIREVAEHSAKL